MPQGRLSKIGKRLLKELTRRNVTYHTNKHANFNKTHLKTTAEIKKVMTPLRMMKTIEYLKIMEEL